MWNQVLEAILSEGKAEKQLMYHCTASTSSLLFPPVDTMMVHSVELYTVVSNSLKCDLFFPSFIRCTMAKQLYTLLAEHK